MDQFPRIPVTILTGFLGAGKTTLLNKLVKQNADKKLAIIENEFGEISIDHELVVGVEDDIFTLSNGCICCSLNGDLLQVLLKLINSNEKIDHLIIETTGIADPDPIALNFLTDEDVQMMFRLNAIVTLVDAINIEKQLVEHEEACKQVALADILLLNKIEHVEQCQKASIMNILKRMNPHAQIYQCNYGELGEINLLEINAYESKNIFKTLAETNFNQPKPKKFSVASARIKSDSMLLKNYTKPVKHSTVASYSFVFNDVLDILKFDRWIRLMLSYYPAIYRIKGILSIDEEEEKVVFQSVRDQFVTERAGLWGSEERINKIVFIGNNLDKKLIENGLKRCYCTGEPFTREDFADIVSEIKVQAFKNLIG